MTSTIKSAAALAELAASVVETLANGKKPSEYTLAMIQRHAAAVCGCDPSDGYADILAEIDAEDDAREQREWDSEQADRRFDYLNMIGLK